MSRGSLARKITPSAFVSQSRASSRARHLASWNVGGSGSLLHPSSSLSPSLSTSRLQQFQFQHRTLLAAAKKKTTTATIPDTGRPYRLVIVESPSKCKTIEKILNSYVKDNGLDYDFVVTSCYGHIRNLPKNNQQLKTAKYVSGPTEVVDDDLSRFPYPIVGVDLSNDYQPTYVLLEGKESLVKDLQHLSSNAQQVYLATDPDREGEAIAWHLQEVLGLDDSMERLLFAEITPQAIESAVQNPTQVHQNLVQAQETRRILDRLAGFTVSPVLWKKIAPGLSAGRVQSVGMALCVQRERERLVFQPMDYWDVQGNFTSATAGMEFEDNTIHATLASVNGTSLVAGKADFVDNEETGKPQPKDNKRLLTQIDAEGLVQRLQEDTTRWQVTSVKGRERTSNPSEPFKTSTLQQESNQRLGMSVSQTMRTAQQLYEAGWISYMRTDATHLSDDAHKATRQAITSKHGPNYVDASKTNSAAKKTKSKKKKKDSQSDKVAQEAHEAIRPAIQPTGQFADPSELASSSMPEAAQKLYSLIFRRTLASRMIPQRTNQTTVVLEGTTVEGDVADFRATGSVVLEPGFTLEWNRGNGDSNRALPPVQEGQDLSCEGLEPQSHTTQPPARYTEASLVKELEARGVGRPSTYAGIVQILRDRAYVGSPTSVEQSSSRNNRKEASGAAITAQRAAGGGDLFGARGPLAPSLSAFVVTSLLEQHCPTYVDPSFTARMEENLDRIANANFHDEDSDGEEEELDVAQQRVAYLNEFYAGEQGLAAQIKRIDDSVEAEDARRADLPALETSSDDEADGKDIGIYIGPWGPYIQQKDGSKDPVKATLPPGMATDLSSITLGTLKMLVENKQSGTVLGQHPEDGRNIYLLVGRFGAYLQWGERDEEGTTTHSLPKHLSAMRNLQPASQREETEEEAQDTPFDDSASLGGMLGITFEEAVGYCGLPRTVATYEDKPITCAIGPYGPYLKYDNKYTSLHKKDGDVLTVDEETATRLVIDGIINKKTGAARNVMAELGEKDGDMVTVKDGRFGPYLNWRKVNAKLPLEYEDDPGTMPLEQAWELIQEKAKQPPKAKKGSKKKDVALPPAPKRALSAYMHFCAAKRPEVAASGKSLGEVAKDLGAMWADISETDRKPYDDLAEAGKEEYQKRKAAWEEECKKLQGGTQRSSSVSDPFAPKRARSAYIYFCNAKRPEVSQRMTKMGDISKELARMWAETTDRTEYEALAAEDKARYELQKAEYDQADYNQGNKASSTTAAATPQRAAARSSAASNRSASRSTSASSSSAPKRARWAYIYFCNDKRPAVAQQLTKLGDISKELARMWAETTDRSKYEAMAAEDKARYELEKAEYNQESHLSSANGAASSRVKGVPKRVRVVGGSRSIKSKRKKATGTKKSKRAPSAYMIFCRETRHEIVDENGAKLPLGETTKILAERWKHRDDATRAKFEAMAAEEKEKLMVVA